MAAMVHKVLGGRTNYPDPIRLAVTSAEAITVGEMLVVTSNLLTKASGDVTVAYIAAEAQTAEQSTAGRKCLVYKVDANTVYEVPLYAYSATTQLIGAGMTIHTDGLQITATGKTNGVGAIIWDLQDADAAGDRVLVTFA